MTLTTLLTGLRLNSTFSSDLESHQTSRLEPLFQMLKLRMMLTGLLKERLPQLKIKEDVDHAGLSQLLEPSNQDMPLRLERLSNNGLSNNSLTAQPHTETTDAMVDGWIMPSTMLPRMTNSLRLHTHITLKMNHAKLLNISPLKLMLETLE